VCSVRMVSAASKRRRGEVESVQSEEPDVAPDTAERLAVLLEGFQVTQTIAVAAKLQVFDVLRDGPKSAEEIAHAVGAHAPSLFRLLRYLCAVGVLAQEEGQRFVVTSLGDLLRSDHPESLRPLAILYGSSLMWRPYGELYASVVDGRCA